MKHFILLLSLMLAPLTSFGQLAEVEQVDEELRFEEELTSFNAGLSLEEIEANDHERKRLTHERKNMRHRIGNYNQQNKTLSKRLERSRESMAKVQALHLEESNILKETKAANDRLQASNNAIDKELNSQEQQVLQQRNEVATLRQQIADGERHRADLLQRQGELKKELLQKRKVLKNLRAQREKQERRNQKLSSDVEKLESVNSEVGQQLSRLN